MAADTAADGKSKLEFDVNMTCGGCAASVRESLQKIGVHDAVIDVEKQIVVVETNIPITNVQEAIRSTGKVAVLKGFGSSEGKCCLSVAQSSAVIAESIERTVTARAQFSKVGAATLVSWQNHRLRIHELGDLSNGCQSTGDCLRPASHHIRSQGPQGKYGSLGEIDVDDGGRSVFRRTNDIVKVWDIIGRSLVVCSESPSKSHGGIEDCSRLACGIIARASGVAQNPKRICACDGVSVWDEQNPPNTKKNEI
ncbi:hypothetical protein HPB50_015477 [Hyalomma asiaticum]|uniref:Uncharacterized protein n=1 Tax=Hyalomma asiaticum TaxID=266040 RepID=A0ACB7RRI5_HYAAI|nr:hypothetical protein HPB50_015477 [Hyalomma asiaticum]